MFNTWSPAQAQSEINKVHAYKYCNSLQFDLKVESSPNQHFLVGLYGEPTNTNPPGHHY